MSSQQIRGFINPLMIFEWDPAFNVKSDNNPRPELLLQRLCSLNVLSDMSELKRRYRRVSKNGQTLPFSFEEPEIKENLFEPLRQAKMNYVLGNYVSTIALCGIVAEKLAILIHRMNTRDEAKRAEFEKCFGQGRRLERLKELRLINKQSASDFGNIKAARNEALHHWNIPEKRTAQRAAQSFAFAIRLVLDTIGFKFVNGAFVPSPGVSRYLKERGEIPVEAEGE